MAYAEVAGLPPVVGPWGDRRTAAGDAVLGSSGQLSVGPESTTALMTASVVARLWPFWPLISTGCGSTTRFASRSPTSCRRIGYINPVRPAADGHRRRAGRPTFNSAVRMPTAI